MVSCCLKLRLAVTDVYCFLLAEMLHTVDAVMSKTSAFQTARFQGHCRQHRCRRSHIFRSNHFRSQRVVGASSQRHSLQPQSWRFSYHRYRHSCWVASKTEAPHCSPEEPNGLLSGPSCVTTVVVGCAGGGYGGRRCRGWSI